MTDRPTVRGKPEAKRPHHEIPAEARSIRFGLFGKTTVTMLLVSLLPLVLFGGFALVQQSRRIGGEAELAMQRSAEQITAQVDEWFDKNVRVLQAAASLPAVATMRADEQTKVLGAIRRAYPWMYLVHTIALDGKNAARSDEKAPMDYGDRQYVKDVLLGGKALSWETVIGKTSNKPALVLAVPIIANGGTVGVLSAAMTIEDISRIVGNWRTGKSGFAFLVDERAKVVAHPREEFVVSQTILKEHQLVAAFRADGKAHSLRFTQSDGSDVLGYVQGNRSGWAVAIQQDVDELFAPVRQTLTFGLALLLAAALLVALTATLASRALVRPIVEMTYAADRMSMGELDEPISASAHDELGVLAHSLERLRKSQKAALARLQQRA
ncbi:MAG TPA: cache and HAMP domain-containing protein [Anaeromyxobacter sp.]